MQCGNNLKQIGLAAHLFHESTGKFPPQFGWFGSLTSGNYGTLFFHLLPYIEQSSLFETAYIKVKDSPPYPCGYQRTAGTHDSQQTIVSQMVGTYVCPSDSSVADCVSGSWALGSYAGNFRVFGNLGNPSTVNTIPATTYVCDATARIQWQGESSLGIIQDGTSNTLLFAEKYALCNATNPSDAFYGGTIWPKWDGLDHWQPAFAVFVTGPSSMFQDSPGPEMANPALAQTPHRGAMNACLADGSVRSLSSSLQGTTWWSLCTPANGEVLGDF